MRHLVTTIAALLVSTPALAARHEVSFEYQGTVTSEDTVWGIYGNDVLSGFGLRAGGAVLKHPSRFGLTVLGAWSRASMRTYDGGFDGAFSSSSFYESTLRTDRVTVGVKADYDVAGWFFPYVKADGGLVIGMSDFSVEADPDDDITGSRRTALAPLGQFTGGVEFMLPDTAWGWPVTAGIFVEGGYEVAGGLAFADLGEPLRVGGALIRSGIGLRF